MLSRYIRLRFVAAALAAGAFVSVSPLVQAQVQPERPPNGHRPAAGGGAGFWNPEFMMDLYVKALTRSYNLTPDQEEYTRKLLTKRVREFLKTHETDLRTLMFEMFEFQGKRQLPPSETAKQWAEMGQPIFKDARKAILDGNKEWREILDEKQRQRHDQDMAMMERQFKVMEERLNRWEKGDIQPEDFTPAGSRGQIGGEPPWTESRPEDTWEMYLRAFAVRYGLDDSQKETAQSVLRECRDRARDYREKHKAETDEIDAKMKELKESRSKQGASKESLAEAAKQLDELRAKKVELEKPISQGIFAEFKHRLDQIPTKEQKLAFEQKEKARLEAIRQRMEADKKASELPTTRPAASATAPAQG